MSEYNGHIRVTKSEEGIYILDYLVDYPGTSSQTVQFGQNLLDFRKHITGGEFATVIIPLGEKLENSRYEEIDERRTIASVNGGSIYLASPAAELYGRIEQTVDFGDISSASELKQAAEQYLADTQYDNIEIELDALDLNMLDISYEAIKLLDVVRIVSAPHGMDHSFPVRRIEIPLGEPENSKYTLGSEKKKGLIKKVKEKQQEVDNSIRSSSYQASRFSSDLNKYNNDLNGIKNDYQKSSTLGSDVSSYLRSSGGKSDLDSYVSSDDGKTSLTRTLSTTFLQDGQLKAKLDTYVNGDGHATISASLSSTFLGINELKTKVDQYVNSTDGRARIVATVSGTYQTKADMSTYVTETKLNTEIGQYIDTSSGQAKIIQAASGTYQKKSEMGDFVKVNTLGTQISQYIDTQAGTAKIVQSVSGTYQRMSDMTNYYTKTESVSKIEQQVAEGLGKLTLTVSNGEEKSTITLKNGTTTISAQDIQITGMVTFSQLGTAGKTTINGSNITTGTISLNRIDTSGLDIVATNKDTSSTISLKNGSVVIASTDVQFTGGVTFNDLKNNSNTVINGSYITTGTISADRINTTSLKLKSVYGYDGSSYILNSNNTSEITLGGYNSTDASFNYVYINANRRIRIGSSLYDGIVVDTQNKQVTIKGATLGGSTAPVSEFWATMAYIGGWEIGTLIRPRGTASSYSNNYDLGSSGYPVNHMYSNEVRTTRLYVNGTEMKPQSSSGGTYMLYPNGNTSSSYSIVYDSSAVLRPSSSYYNVYLGSNSYFWPYAYIGSKEVKIGNSTSSYIGFYGTSPVNKRSVSTSDSLSTLISALQRLGLV